MVEEYEDSIDVTGMTLRELCESDDPRIRATMQRLVDEATNRPDEVYWTHWSEDGRPTDGS